MSARKVTLSSTRSSSAHNGSNITLNSTVFNNTNGPIAVKDRDRWSLNKLADVLAESEIDLGMNRPFCMGDFDKLNSENMVKIVNFLYEQLDENTNYLSDAVRPLNNFNQFEVGNSVYLADIDNVYHKVKPIFDKLEPLTGNIFHYCVLLVPNNYRVRSKLVLSHLCQFAEACQKLKPEFKNRFEQVMEDNSERAQLFETIEKIKDKIHEQIQMLASEKDKVCIYEREVKIVEEENRKFGNQLARQNEAVELKRGHYEKEVREVKRLQEKNGQLETEKNSVEREIVADADAFVKESQLVKEKLKQQTDKRKAFGDDLNLRTEEIKKFEEYKVLVKTSLEDFARVIEIMKDVHSTKIKISQSDKGIATHIKSLESLKPELEELIRRHKEKVRQINTLETNRESTSEQHKIQLPRIESKIKEVQRKTKHKTGQMKTILKEMKEMENQITHLKEKIEYFVHVIQIEIPHLRSEEEAKVLEHREAVTEQLVDAYPESLTEDDL